MDVPHHRTAHLSRRALALIHRHQQRARPDPKPRHEPPHHHLVPLGRGRRDLDDEPDMQDHAPERDGPFAADAVCQGAGHQGAQQRANRQLTEQVSTLDYNPPLGQHMG